MRRPLSAHKVITRGWAIAASLTVAGALLTMGGSAAAFPQPSVAEVQHELSVLNNKLSTLGQQYDEVRQQLSLANQRLRLLKKETKRYHANFEVMHAQIDRIAAVAFEQGSINSPLTLLTSSSPQQVLDQSSILGELSAVDSAQINAYLAASRQLITAQQAASRTRTGILRLKHSLGKRLSKLKALQTKEEALLVALTPVQRVKTVPGGGSGGGNPPPYKGPTGTQADTAVQFAYHQIGCPYYFGGTGPCTSPGFDCSGLMMQAWASAGISIPRVSYDQMADLQPVSLHTASGAFTTANLEPGDILGFGSNSHVGMYVGGGYLIDAPTPGAYVEKVSLTGWYMDNLDGAVRP